MASPIDPTPISRSGAPQAESLLLEQTTSGSERLIARLQQLGSFRAQVMLAEGRQVLLDTAFGQLRGQLPEGGQGPATRLQPGDRIEAQLARGDGPPRLVVRQHQPLQQSLNQPALHRALQLAPNQALAARVAGSSGQETRLLIGRDQYAIPRDNRLQAGDVVMLRPGDRAGQVELQRIQPLPLLRQALSRLLPQQASAGSDGAGSGLGRLQQIARQLLGQTGQPQAPNTSRPGSPATPAATATAARETAQTLPAQGKEASPAARTTTAANVASPQSRSAIRAEPPLPPSASRSAATTRPAPVNAMTSSAASENPAPGQLQRLLQPLLRMAIDPQQPSPQQLQRTLAELGLATTTGGTATLGRPDLLPRLIELQALLRDQPELFERLIREQTTASAQSPTREAAASDHWTQWRQQFGQLLDQGINQLLLGKTGLRLQQEQQLPVNANLVLPLQLPNEPERELRLKLRERSNPDNPERPAWEVHLSFEFGLLGLITVHLLLQEERISAHFWAVEERTWRLIDEQLPSFRQQLLRSGFQPGLFDCFQGQPKADDDPPQTGGDSLLDIQV